MSAKLMGMVLDADLPRPEKFVLAMLADHGKEDGTDVYPSVARIEFKTGYSERQVRDLMTSLQKRGLLVLVQEGGRGAGDTNEYRIVVEKIPVMDFREWVKKKKGAVFSEGRVQFSPNKGAVLSKQGCKKLQNKGAKTAPELKTNNQEQELKAEQQAQQPAPKNLFPIANGKNSQRLLSPSERDSWDLRRWQVEMRKTEPQVGVYIPDPDEHWLRRARDAAYMAGLTLERLQEIIRPHFPKDPLIERLDPNKQLQFTGAAQ